MIIPGAIIGGAVAAVLLTVLFVIYSKSKSAKEILVRDVSKLKSGNVSESYLVESSLNGPARHQILDYFTTVEAKLVEGTNHEIIAYVNKFNKAFLMGIFDLHPQKFPVRIIISESGSGTKIQMDDSYGPQKFVGKAKEVFAEKNQEAFAHYHEKLVEILKGA